MEYKAKKRRGIATLAVGMVLLAGQLLMGRPEDPSHGILKAQMRVLEAVINETIGQTFAPPFGLLEKAKGTYLADFGVAFSLEVNLYPLRVPNMFNVIPFTKEELEKARKAKLERIGIIKQAVPRLLADHASALREVPPEESVAVIVHLFHFQAEGEKLPTQIVIQVKKRDLDQYWEKKLSYGELREKVKVLEL